MSFLKILSFSLLLADAYIGIRFLLNVLHILHTSKYSKAATVIYAFLFLGLALWGLYLLLVKNNLRLGLWISIAPWVILLILLFLSMILGDYK